MSLPKESAMLNISLDQLLASIRDAMTENTIESDITLETAIEQFFLAKRAQRLSEHTLEGYRYNLDRFVAYIGKDTRLASITPSHIRAYLASLNPELSAKSVLNIHVTLSSLWTWAVGDGLVREQIVRKVTPPKPEERLIHPLAEDEIKRLLAEATKRDPKRNRAIILVLLDTGLRASELCDLKIGDLQGTYVRVMGKGNKERQLPLSPGVLHALLDYLATRHKATRKSPLFVVKGDKPMSRWTLLKWLHRAGIRAGLGNVHPHRFRHTFATVFLRNGGDALSLQRLLGHSSLDMVKIYVDLAQGDLEMIHRRASPVKNWDL
jgi:integrase/recombinase XerD